MASDSGVDGDVRATELRVSLTCSLSQQRISLPCRPDTCAHVRCFDLLAYLSINEREETWECPVCLEPAPLDTLRFDR